MFSTQSCTLHGVFLQIFQVGALIIGSSGIGKSELALGLINRNHALIADDSVEITTTDQGTLIGACFPLLQDFLEVRGLGPLNIRAMYGDQAIAPAMQLDFIIEIKEFKHEELINIDRIHGMNSQKLILGITIPTVTIPVSPGRNLAVLVEAAVKNQLLKVAGLDASQQLCMRQENFIKASEVKL